MDRLSDFIAQVRLACEDKEKRVSGIHIEVKYDLDFIEVFGFEQVSFVNKDDRYFFLVYDKVFDRALDGIKQVNFSAEHLACELKVQLPVKFYLRDGG